MRASALACLSLFAAVAASFAQSPTLEVLWQKDTLQPVARRTLYRFATCPSGLTLITSTNGDFLAMASDGTVLANRHEDELVDVTASTCDPTGRLLVVTQGWLKVFDLDGQADLDLDSTHWIAGGPTRLMATPEGDLYAVGMAFQDGRHVFLRRFRLSDGSFLGVPDVNLPFTSPSGFNSFAVNGCMAWNASKQEAIYFAANPAIVWRIRTDGAASAVLPQALAFQNAQVAPDDFGRGNWQAYDWIRNVVPLPDGRMVAQVFRGKDNPPPEGESFAYLFVINDDYQTVAGKIASPAQPFLGLLSGSDADGNLYFVDLLANSVAKVVKARLTP